MFVLRAADLLRRYRLIHLVSESPRVGEVFRGGVGSGWSRGWRGVLPSFLAGRRSQLPPRHSPLVWASFPSEQDDGQPQPDCTASNGFPQDGRQAEDGAAGALTVRGNIGSS